MRAEEKKSNCRYLIIFFVFPLFPLILLFFSLKNLWAREYSVELLHFWHSPGEQQALHVIKDSVIQDGGIWQESIFRSMAEERKEAADRICKGNAPTAIQWHAGPELHSMPNIDIIRDLSGLAKKQKWHEFLSPIVMQSISVNGKPYAVPTNVHGENWIWYNSHIYRELDLDFPKDWKDFLAKAQQIRAAGYWPLVVGTEKWHGRLLFHSILIGVGGQYEYLLLGKGNEEAVYSKAVSDAFRIMERLKEFTMPFEKGEKVYSHEAAHHMMEGRAAAFIMGDWIKSEFKLAGKKPKIDYHCDLVPGSNDTMLVVVDAFIFPKGRENYEMLAGNMLIHHMLRAEVQQEFGLRKSAIPARLDVDMSEYDYCAKAAMKRLMNRKKQLPGPPMFIKEGLMQIINRVTSKFWNDREMRAQEAIEELHREFVTYKYVAEL